MGEKDAKQASNKNARERDQLLAREQDLNFLLSAKGADVEKSYARIKSFQAKERSARDSIDIQVYNEAMANLLQ